MKSGSDPDLFAPLAAERLPIPEPGPRQLLLEVRACGVCRTNLHIADGEQFMRFAAEVPLRTETSRYALGEANQALAALRAGRVTGAAVLVPERLSAV